MLPLVGSLEPQIHNNIKTSHNKQTICVQLDELLFLSVTWEPCFHIAILDVVTTSHLIMIYYIVNTK